MDFPRPLVSTSWLAENLDNPSVRVLDCRWYLQPFDSRDGSIEYAAGHIPGALHVNWARDLADPAYGTLNMLAAPERYEAAMAACGVGSDSLVVTYDDHHVPVASRVWWTLRTYGHENVSVLDGGITAWRSEGRPLESGLPATPTPPASPFLANFRPQRYATKQDVLDAIEQGTVQLVDARMDVAYHAASGHIPGAVRVTGLGFLADGEHWSTPEECRARIAAAGVEDAPETILYCGGGVAATGALLGWTLAGLGDNVRVYDGSWGEWEQDPATPKERHQ